MTGATAAPFACPDWWDKLRRGETPIAALPMNEDRARRAVALYNSLRLPDVPGKPRLAEASGEWFRDVVRNAFATEHPETGLPLVSEIFCMVPKKNNKTTGSAALGLTGLMMIDRPNAKMQILGPTQKVATRCFNQARGMIEADPKLKKVFHVQDHKSCITRIKTGAELTVKTFDMDVVTGEIPALTIVDEEHLIAAKRYAKRVMAQLRGGMITNPEALLVIITTQSDIEPQGVFKEDLATARGIRDGTITEGVRMLPVIYEFPEDVQRDETRPWQDPEMWPLVLPNLGRSVQLPLLTDLYLQERQKGHEAIRIWASQHLNIQVGLGLQDGRWAGADFWERNRRDGLTLQTILEECDVAVVGGDAGGADDLFAITVIGRHAESRKWMTWSHCWCLRSVIEGETGPDAEGSGKKPVRGSIAARLTDLADAGDVTVTDLAADHIAGFADFCEQLRDAGLLPENAAIGLDPWGIAALVDELLQRGFTTDQVNLVSQGYKLNGAIKGLERRLADGTVEHGGQDLMTWCMGNARAETRGNNIYVTKQAAGSAKIDPVVAMFNAAMLMDLNPVAARKLATPWDRDPNYRLSA